MGTNGNPNLGGETQKTPENGIPFFITQARKARLRELGYTDEQIALMRPAEAEAIVRAAGGPLSEAPPGHYAGPPSTSDEEEQLPIRFSDIALSDEFVRDLGSDWLYVAAFDRWYTFDPSRGLWAHDNKLLIFTTIKRFLKCIAIKEMEIAEAAAELCSKETEKTRLLRDAQELCKYLTTAKKVWNVVSATRWHKKIAALPEWFDADNFLLNTPAGVLDLDPTRDPVGVLRPARREDYFSKTTPCAPQDVSTPTFDVFLKEIMGWWIKPANCECAACAASQGKPEADRTVLHQAEVDELAEYQKRVYGQALNGDVTEQKLILQIGEGGNGKGTHNDFMTKYIFGNCPLGYACEIPVEALLQRANEQHPTELMDLFHSRLALARESDENTNWNEGKVKRLTGADRIKARYMRQDYVEFDPTHTLIVFGNAKPSLTGSDQAAWKRRLQMTLFQQLWDDQADETKGIRKRDPRLLEKLRNEAPGVLHKLAQYSRSWYLDRDLKPPETVRQATSNYLAEQSIVRAFIDDRCIRQEFYNNITVADLWPHFQNWAKEHNESPGKRNSFNDKLRQIGIKIVRQGGTGVRGVCQGLRLKDPPDARFGEDNPRDDDTVPF
jgi:putative DNA primase/helicase